MRFLYHTVPGRCVLKGLVQPGVSRAAGRFLDSALSARLVPGFVRRHRIDMTAYRGQRYTSFNAFFTRKKQEAALSETEGILLSPCDAFLSAYLVGDDSVFRIKHVEYSLAQLLRDQKVAGRFAGGTCLIFRLTPQHYHRYSYACSGRLRLERTLPGVLHRRPREHERAAVHRLAQQRLAPLMHHARAVAPAARSQRSRRVHDDADKVAIPRQRALGRLVWSHVQQRQAGLRGHRQRHLVAHLQAVRAGKLLARQKVRANAPQALGVRTASGRQEWVARERALPERVWNGRRAPEEAPQPAREGVQESHARQMAADEGKTRVAVDTAINDVSSPAS